MDATTRIEDVPRSREGWARAGRTLAIAIIGAGMSGIDAVVKLRKAGYTDLTVDEKADRVGGTWREDSYHAEIREALPHTSWVTSGCNSWSLDKTGLPNLYPWSPAASAAR